MITLSINCSRVSVRSVNRALQTRECRASHLPSRSFGVASSEAATVSPFGKERTR